MKHFISFAMIVTVWSSACFAQSRYIELHQNAIGFDVGYSTDKNRDIDGITGTLGYSSWGLLDLGISLSRVSVQGFYGGKDYTSTISPYLSYLIVKQDAVNPISLGLSASYQETITENSEVVGSHIAIGPGFFTDLRISNEFFMQPNANFAILVGKSKKMYSNNERLEQNNSMFLANIGLSLVFVNADESILAINPAVAFQKDITLFGLSASMLFLL